MSRSAYKKPLSYLWSYLSTDQQTWSDAQGVCFDQLILGPSILLDFYVTRCTPVSSPEPTHGQAQPLLVACLFPAGSMRALAYIAKKSQPPPCGFQAD